MRYLMSAQSMDPTKAKQIALQFHYTDWEFDNDMNSTMLRQMGADPFEIDVATANEFMKQHNLPYRVRRMFLQGENLHFELDSNMTEAPMSYGKEGRPEWYDRAVQMKLDNPSITAAEIARQVGTSRPTIYYWLTGRLESGGTRAINRPMDSFPFKPEDFPQVGNKKYFDGAKPEWYDQALKMGKAGESFMSIGRKLGVSASNVSNWLVKGRRYTTNNKLVNPDAELEPRKIRGQKLNVNLLKDFINDGYTDEDIIELVLDDKGPKIANQVRGMLPELRKKLNPGTQVIDKTRTGDSRDPDITGLV